MNVLYSDRHLIVFDKPAGIPVIPPREGGVSVAGETGLFVCHRIDRDTSGCLVMARSAAGQRILSQAFAEGRVGKRYRAVAVGQLPDEGFVDLPIGTWHRGRVSVGRGRPSQTRYQVRWRDGARLGVEAEPLTGRTHQIRAHLASAGAPLLGDPTYGGPAADRLYLHAWRLCLPWPAAGQSLNIEAPLPPEFECSGSPS